MKSSNTTLFVTAVTALSAGFVQSASAAGYEKSIMFSGRYGAQAGAAVGAVTGAESLFFNPAGLAGGEGRFEISGNFSPTVGSFKGPITFNAQSLASKSAFSPIFGAFASYKPMDKLGIGFGVYTPGGANSVYEGVEYTGFTTKPNVQAQLSVTEISLGAGYEIIDGLRVGLGWRALIIQGHLSAASTLTLPALSSSLAALGSHSILTAVDIDKITDNRFNGFRVGLQYAPKNAGWGVGAQLRTGVKFLGKGTTTVTQEIAGAAVANSRSIVTADFGNADVTNEFPLNATLGGYYDVLPRKLRVSAEYGFTQYARNRYLDITSSGTVAHTTSTTVQALSPTTTAIPINVPVSDIAQNWKNQHTFRIGAEYMLDPQIAIRGGYNLSTAVTPPEAARATFAAPGLGHSITVGGGYNLMAGLDINLALEYARVSGRVNDTQAAAGSSLAVPNTTRTGTYAATGMGAHLGVTYTF